MIGEIITLVLSNFGLAMFVMAALFIVIHNMIMRGRMSQFEIVYRWLALFPLGLGGIYTFVMHVFYPEISSAIIGWAPSPFQYEAGIADLSFGVLAVLSFNASFSFRLAAVIGNVIWLFGDSIQHIYLMFSQGNYNVGNAGSWLWLDDIILPLLMIICINGLSKLQKQ